MCVRGREGASGGREGEHAGDVTDPNSINP